MATEGSTITGIPGRGGATILFNNAREAVKHGDAEYVRGYLMTVAGAVTNTGSDGKTLLHSAALSGQTGIIAELLVAGANPYARCSSGETPLDLARRNGHNESLSCLLRHPPLSAPTQSMSQTTVGLGRDAAGTASALAGATDAASSTLPRKGSRVFFRSWRRSGPKGGDDENPKEEGSTALVTKTKKGRGKRPVLLRASGNVCDTPHGTVGSHEGGIDVGGGWVLYTDAEGFQYCWNETLNESRWVDQSNALTVAAAPSPGYHVHAPPSSQTISGSGGGSNITCGPSPTYSNASGHSWETNIYGYGNNLASPVHSPGWPSPRATEAGLMQLPLPPTPTNYRIPGASAHSGTFARVPPSPPAYSDVKGDAVGVAWLSETKMPSATKSTTKAEERTTAAAAAAGQADRPAITAGGTANVANSAFYGQAHSPSPATRERLWAERVKAADGRSETDGIGAPPDAAQSRGWMKKFRHRRDPKDKGGRSTAPERSRIEGGRGGGTFVESGHDGDDISTLTEATGERDRRDGSSSSGSDSSTSSRSSSSSSSSGSSGGSGSSSSTSTHDDSSSSTESSGSSSDTSDSSTAIGNSVDSAIVDQTAVHTTLGEEFVPQRVAPLTTATYEAPVPSTAGPSGSDNTSWLPPQAWGAQQPTVARVPAGMPDDCEQHIHPVGTAFPGGDGNDSVAPRGWADLEPQTLPPYAPTALWRQEETLTAYHGVPGPPEMTGTQGYGLEQQQQQQLQLPGETDSLITLSSSPPSGI